MIRVEYVEMYHRTYYDGYPYPTRLEAGCAKKLDDMVKGGLVKSWERQYKIVIKFHDPEGKLVGTKEHKVDFMAKLKDRSKLLIEAKGAWSQDYKVIYQIINSAYLPQNLDTEYKLWTASKYVQYNSLRKQLRSH